MKTLAAFSLALALMASSAITLRAQERDRGPAAYKSGETITGEITRIDNATKTIEVTPSNAPGAVGTATPLEYQAKDSTELTKFHMGQTVSGKVSKDTPPKLLNLKASFDKKQGGGMGGGMKDSSSTAPSGVRDSARTGGMSSPRN